MPEVLWAPWRFEYLTKPSVVGDCSDIFLDLPADGDDRKNLILFRGNTAFMMLNAYPYASGHVMVAPYRQVVRLDEMSDTEMLEAQRLIAKSIQWLRASYAPDGFNIGMNMGKAAGAGIPDHIHWHVVPRWSGDTNFMTTVGAVKVMPQSLEESYDLILRIASEVG